MRIRGPRYGSTPIAASGGLSAAAPIAPRIAQSIQAGKLAPAMLTTGSHPESADAASAMVVANHPPENFRPILIAAKIARNEA